MTSLPECGKQLGVAALRRWTGKIAGRYGGRSTSFR